VSEACLELQEKFNLDINLLLFCLWYSRSYGKFDVDILRQVWEFSQEWKNNVVEPMRSARRWMKINSATLTECDTEDFVSLREKIKVNELKAEKYQQLTMEKLVLQTEPLPLTEISDQSLQDNLHSLFEIHSLPDEISNDPQLGKIIEAFASARS
jgi:uncharacterized protein (TIGR02444 family)